MTPCPALELSQVVKAGVAERTGGGQENRGRLRPCRQALKFTRQVRRRSAVARSGRRRVTVVAADVVAAGKKLLQERRRIHGIRRVTAGEVAAVRSRRRRRLAALRAKPKTRKSAGSSFCA